MSKMDRAALEAEFLIQMDRANAVLESVSAGHPYTLDDIIFCATELLLRAEELKAATLEALKNA